MSFAVITVPDFALHALRRIEGGLRGKAVGIVAGEGRKATVVQVSAEAAGAEPGFAVTLAMARCPGIILRAREPEAEHEAAQLLIALAFTLSPRVEATAEDCCTIDLRGVEFGRLESELRRVVAELAQAGLPARAGSGPTPLLASLAAQEAEPVLVIEDLRGFLDPLPIEFAQPTARQALILTGWGIKTLGQFTTIGKAAVGQRMGSEGVALWERAAGETVRVLKLVEPAKTFEAEWIYEPPIDSLEPLAFKLQRYAERLALELKAAGMVADRLTLTLVMEDEARHEREFRLPEPGANVAIWLRVVLTHLETVRTAAAVQSVRLVASPARPEEKQDGLFETGLVDPSAFWENLARLSAVVGEGRVGTPVGADTHRPDSFVLAKPARTLPAPEAEPLHPRRGGALRRFRPPWMVRVGVVAGKPAALFGEVKGTVLAVAGPWRTEGSWWTLDPWAVENWQVELPGGIVYQLALVDGDWWVEGVVD